MTLKKESNLEKLTILRGIGTLGIFLLHAQIALYSSLYITEYNSSHFLNILNLKSAVINIALFLSRGIDISALMMLSGFAIHWSFLNAGQSFNFKSFLSKRIWRLYPAYLFVLIACCLLLEGSHYYTSSKAGLLDFFTHIFLIHNFSENYIFSINGSFWTMGLEVQLYLIYPVFLFIRAKTGVVNAFYCTMFISLTSYFFCKKLISPDSKAVELFFVNIWNIWCLGALLAEKFYLKERIIKNRVLPLILFSGVMLVLSRFYLYTSFLTEPILIFIYFVSIEWVLYTDRINLKAWAFRFLYYAGLCSYSIYLIHQPFLYYRFGWLSLSFFKHGPAFLKLIPLFALIFLISYLMYLFIEMPFIKAGRFFRNRKKLKSPGEIQLS